MGGTNCLTGWKWQADLNAAQKKNLLEGDGVKITVMLEGPNAVLYADGQKKATVPLGEEYAGKLVQIQLCMNGNLTGGNIEIPFELIKASEEHIHTPATAVVENKTDATCGAAGSYDSVVYCSVCSELLSKETITVPATGAHTWDDGVITKDPTYTETGVKTYTCSGCGKTKEESIPVKEASDADVTVAHSMQAFLTLKNEVFLNIAFKLDGTNGANAESMLNKVGVLIWAADELPEEALATVDSNAVILTGAVWNAEKQRYEVRTEGIPAKELGDKIAFRAFYIREDGTYVYGRIIASYSPADYCYGQLKNDDTSDDALMIALLNYGAAAQEYFGYRTDDLANAKLTEEQKIVNWDDSLVRSDWSVPAEKEGALARSGKIISRGGFLSLVGAIDYNYYAKVDSSVQVKSAKLLCWSEDAYNSLDVLTAENAETVLDMEWVEDKGCYNGTFEGLAAKDMFKAVYACVMIEDVDGNIYYSGVVSYCPERYAYISMTDKDATNDRLACCIINYGDAARAYFNNN